MEEIETLNPAHKLAKRLQENRNSLHIARLPDKTRIDFIALAEAEFCGDYGMALKWLMDDLISPDTKLIMEKLSEFDLRLIELENGSKPEEAPKTKARKMLDGSTKRRLD